MMKCPFCNTPVVESEVTPEQLRCAQCGSLVQWAKGRATPAAGGAPAAPAKPPADDDEPVLSIREIVKTLVQRGDQPPPTVRGTLIFEPGAGGLLGGPQTPSLLGGSPLESKTPPAATPPAATPPPPAAVAPPAAAGSGSEIYKTLDATPGKTKPKFLSEKEQPPPPQGERQARKTYTGLANPTPGDLAHIWNAQATNAGHVGMTLKANIAPEPMTMTGGTTQAVQHNNSLHIRTHRVSPSGEQTSRPNEYELLGTIGVGGVGVVYSARQTSIDRTVALKVLKDDFAFDADHRQKFLSEAVVTGELDHPNIVPIYDLGASEEGKLFYAMKRVQGTPWSEVIQSKPVGENLRVLLSVADAIAFAHARGVIHRDLKPENVMLGEFGEVLVMDWGIAISSPTFVKSGRISQSTSMGGTPAYMAPEMATGPMHAIGPLSDVYLLGAILYEIVAGQPPHHGRDVMSCLYAAARNEIQPTPKQGELLEIALRAMATDPAERHATVRDFQAAIREHESHAESVLMATRAEQDLVVAEKSRDYQDFARALFAFDEARELWPGNPQAGPGEVRARLAYARCAQEKEDFDLGLSLLRENVREHQPLRKGLLASRGERVARQRRLAALRLTAITLVGAIFILVTGALVIIGRTNASLRNAKDQIEASAKKLTEQAEEQIKTNKQLAKNNNDLVQAQNNLVTNAKLLQVARDDAYNEAENSRRAQQKALGAGYLAQIGVAAGRVEENSFLDARELLNFYRINQPYFRHWEWSHLDFLCHRERAEYSAGARVERLAADAQGEWLAVALNTGKVIIWRRDAAGLKPAQTLAGPGVAVALAMSADGALLAAAVEGETGAVRRWGRSAQGVYEPLAPLRGGAHPVTSLAISLDGGQLLAGDNDGVARLWVGSAEQPREVYLGHFGPVRATALSAGAGGATLAITAGEDATVRVWRRGETQRPWCVYRGHDGPVLALAAAPNGREIASAGRDRTIQVWDPARVRPFDFGALGKRIASGEIQPQANAPESERRIPLPEHIRLEGHQGEVRSLQFDALGERLLSAASDNTARMWRFRDPDAPDFERVFRGHGGWVRGAVLADEGRLAISGGHDQLLKLWDAVAYEETGVFRGHSDAVTWANFSSDGQRIITAGRDRQAIVWDVAARKTLRVLTDDAALAPQAAAYRLREGHEFLVTTLVRFPPGDARFATGAGDGSVRIWDPARGVELRRFLGVGTISVAAISAGGGWLATGSDGNDVLLWSLDKTEPPLRLSGHTAQVSAAAFAPRDGDLRTVELVTGDVAGGLRLWRWDAASGGFRGVGLAGHEPGYPITAVRYALGGGRILSASQDHAVLQWDAQTGKRLAGLELRHPQAVRALEVAGNGDLACTLCRLAPDHWRFSLYDLRQGGPPRVAEARQAGESFTSLAFRGNDAELLLASSGRDGSRLWSWKHTASTTLQPLWKGAVARAPIWAAAPTHDGLALLTVGGSQARIFEAESGRQAATLGSHAALTCANFSPDGQWAATSSIDGDIKIWAVNAEHPEFGKPVVRISPPVGEHAPRGVNFVAFSPESLPQPRLAAALEDGRVLLYDLEPAAPRLIATLGAAGARLRALDFSPDGQRIVTAADDGMVHLWALGAAEPAGGMRHPAAVLAVRFAPDGLRVITGCDDNKARVWDCSEPAEPRRVYELEGHTAAVTSVAYSPDGLRALTGSNDGVAKLWTLDPRELPAGATRAQELLTLKRHQGEISSVRFSPDGRSVLTSSSDGLALLWLGSDIEPSLRPSRMTLITPPSDEALFDPELELHDPDSAVITSGKIVAEMIPAPSDAAARVILVDGLGVLLRGREVWVAVEEGEPEQAGVLEEQTAANSLTVRLVDRCRPVVAEKVLRAIGWSRKGGITGPASVRLELSSGEHASTAELRVLPQQQQVERTITEGDWPPVNQLEPTAGQSKIPSRR